ncbi:MAG: CbtA family protein [Amaricoccus sp.]|uniref:CbtA family protein n=1 Tax=Amaricoccus sp. TaxID=1872485 RepID=UPI0039E5EF3E
MHALRSMLLLAAASGIVVAIVMTLLQIFSTVPLILAAEVYENAAPAELSPAEPAAAVAAPEAHEHDAAEWQPSDGLQRMSFTAVANAVTAIGFGLLLVAASEFAGGIRGWREGMLWGLAAFAVFTLAPGLGLPPELPAMPAAELVPRQVWWLGTVVATATGLGLIAYGRTLALAALGAALLIVPHLIGAPQPPTHETPIPEDLHHRFVVAVTVTNLVFWLLLGTLVALLRPRFAADLAAPTPRPA